MSNVVQRLVTVAVLVGFVTVSTACYGPFALTKNVYRWNSNIKGSREVNDKWTKELAFFGLIIVPAYPFSLLLDMFIFNSMHFWTGESPIKESGLERYGTRVATVGETTIRWTSSENGATVTYERHGIVERRATIVTSEIGYRLVDEHGTLLSEAEYAADGTVRLLNGECQVVKELSREQLRTIVGDRFAMGAEAEGK
ncbi:MAG: DUF3332 family protein [Nitrospira sp.]|nr:DUF3332 family protein [Nitrospira sp.]